MNIVEILKNKYAKPQNRLNINAEINRVEPPSHLLQRRATKHTKLQGGGWVPKYDGTGLSVVTDPGKYSTAVQHEYYNELGSGYKDINKRVAKMIKSGDWDMSDIDQFPEYKAAYENITGGQGAKASESPKVEKQESTSPGGLSSSSMRGVPAPIMLGAWLGSKLFGSSEPSEEQAPEPAVTPGKVVDPDNEGWSPRLSKYTIRQTEKKIKEGNDVYNIDGYPYTIEEHEDGPRYAPAYPLLDREDRMRATIVARNAYVPGGNPSFTNVNTGDTGDVGGLNHTYTPSEQYTLKQYSRKNFINKLKEKGVYKNESPEYWNKIYEARLVGEKRTNTGGFWSNLTYPLYDLFGFNAGGASTVLDDILTEDEQYEIFGNIPEQLQHKTKSDLDRATGVHGEGYDMGGYWDSWMHGAQDDRAETNRQLAARGRGKQAKVGSRYIDDGSALVRQDAQTNFPWGLPVWSDALQLSKYRPAEAPEGQVNGSEHGNAPTRKSYMTFRNKEFLASLLPYIYGGEYKDPHGKGYKKIEPLKLGDAPRTIADRPGDASSSIMQNFAIGRGKDENGREYIYFKDNYDLNLFGVRDRQGGASGLRKVEPDWATPGFNPYTIYDRIYLDEIESMFGKDAKKPSRSKGTYGEMMPSVPMWHGSKEMPWWFEMLKPN